MFTKLFYLAKYMVYDFLAYGIGRIVQVGNIPYLTIIFKEETLADHLNGMALYIQVERTADFCRRPVEDSRF